MRITTNRADLVSALAWAGKASPKYPAVPVLVGMRLTVAAGMLTAEAFDYEISARARCAGTDAESGTMLVHGPYLADAVKATARGKNVTVTLESAATGVTVSCQGSSVTVPDMVTFCGAEADYPQLPAMPGITGTVAGEAFTHAVTRAGRASCTDDTLPALTAVSFETSPAGVTLAATDRYRLAVDEMLWTPADLDSPAAQYLVPAAILAMFAKVVPAGGKVTIGLPATADGIAGFSDGMHDLTVRLQPGDFPRYGALLPKDHAYLVTADAATLGAAVTRAGKIAGKNEAVRLAFAAESVRLEVHRDGAVVSTETVPCELAGDDLVAAFNPAYLASMLAGVDGTAYLAFRDAGKPVLVTPADTGDSFRGLCMPIRIGG